MNIKNTPADLKWGSHVPINNSVLKTFPISGIVELGAGFHSTPLFFNHSSTVISIENDLSWIERVKSECGIYEDINRKIIHHILPRDVTRSTRRSAIPPEVLDSAIDFYRSFIPIDANLLFVDCYAGFRMEALSRLYTHFDIIVYHDTEIGENANYDYKKFIPNHQYIHLSDQTFTVHTDILISKKYANLIHLFKSTHEQEVGAFTSKYNVKYNPLLVEK